ncbi:fibrobacter succinogenes major paralogous domain-containing protein [Dyadobacter sp. CY261]|uniref:fibrobacter succinogenes major paralogous domain-containing protein n=1 Tax=Dyadobacter sp. CY261 TaxID=2907203 RepID=UPI001F1E8CD9|nr:fibrobacter succinogenes major paralogous domain-containing protein [Dyadobacter sp. CY261]MCF0069502.1 fibrobacter succinogenes major paralogous domain-containing protein [Dyadobacter sp. CY261]
MNRFLQIGFMLTLPLLVAAVGKLEMQYRPASVKIGSQEWSAENLDVTKFRNGESVMEANTAGAWEKACIEGKPAWCYYGQDAVKAKGLGKLYNFWAVVDKRKLAPEGWHVPTDAEWQKLADELGGSDLAGKTLKATKGWKNNGNGDNQARFSALPGGYRSHEGPAYYGGPFFEAGAAGYWWSTTRYLVDNSYCRMLSFRNNRLEKKSFVMTSGLSVRLVKD